MLECFSCHRRRRTGKDGECSRCYGVRLWFQRKSHGNRYFADPDFALMEMCRVVGLRLSPSSSLAKWYDPRVYIRAVPFSSDFANWKHIA